MSTTSNADEVFRKIMKALNDLASPEAMGRGVGLRLLREIDNRVFEQSKLQSGAPIKGGAGYSTNPVIINESQFPRKASANALMKVAVPRGKGNWLFKGGYKSFREFFGRQTGKIDLQLTRRMRANYNWKVTGSRSFGLGFLFPEEAKKAEWNEKRFGKLFGVGPNERNKLPIFVNEFVKERLRLL